MLMDITNQILNVARGNLTAAQNSVQASRKELPKRVLSPEIISLDKKGKVEMKQIVKQNQEETKKLVFNLQTSHLQTQPNSVLPSSRENTLQTSYQRKVTELKKQKRSTQFRRQDKQNNERVSTY